MPVALLYILVFSATFFISYAGLPVLAKKWSRYQNAKLDTTASALEDMFIFVKKNKVYLIFSALPLILGLLSTYYIGWIGAAAGIAVGISLPIVAVQIAKNRRIKKFNQQLVEGIMILSSSLKGGLSFAQALEVLVEDMPPPISQEFGLVLREIHLGVSLDDALNNLQRRIKSEELTLLVSSVLVGKETGGDLTKVFSRLVSTMRDRAHVSEMVQTLTTMGKLQGIIMSLIPVAFVAYVYKINPHHFDVMLKHPLGRALLAACVVLWVVAVILIKKFCTVKI